MSEATDRSPDLVAMECSAKRCAELAEQYEARAARERASEDRFEAEYDLSDAFRNKAIAARACERAILDMMRMEEARRAECRHEHVDLPEEYDEHGRAAQYPAVAECPDCGAKVEVRRG